MVDRPERHVYALRRFCNSHRTTVDVRQRALSQINAGIPAAGRKTASGPTDSSAGILTTTAPSPFDLPDSLNLHCRTHRRHSEACEPSNSIYNGLSRSFGAQPRPLRHGFVTVASRGLTALVQITAPTFLPKLPKFNLPYRVSMRSAQIRLRLRP